MLSRIRLSTRVLKNMLENREYKRKYTLIEFKFLKALLESRYFIVNYNNLHKTILRYENNYSELLKQEFVGSLKYKITKLPHIEGLDKFQVEEFKIFTAKVIVQFLQDYKYEVRRKNRVIKYYDDKGILNTKFNTDVYLQLGGEEKKKNLLKGYQVSKFKLMDNSVHTKVGGTPIKLTSKEKNRYKKMGSEVYDKCISDICSEKLLKKGYSLSKAMNTESRETMEEKEIRYSGYSTAVMALSHSNFNISYWDDARRRAYPKGMLVGANPHGKLWEVCMIDSAKPYIITEAGSLHLIHIIMTELNGRCTKEEAIKAFEADENNILDKLRKLDPYTVNVVDNNYRKAEEEFSSIILLIKAYKAYIQYLDGKPTHYLFGKDLTNSGIGIAGALFRSKEMLYSGNYGSTVAIDSHTEFGKGFGNDIPRNVIKPVHHGLAHGSTWKSLGEAAWSAVEGTYAKEYIDKYGAIKALEKLKEDYGDVTSAEVIEKNSVASYGACVRNIDVIASWGGDIINSNFVSPMWTSIDGAKCQSTAYAEKVEITHHVPSSVNKTKIATVTTIQDMPLKFSATSNFPMLPKGFKGTVKKRGLYANIVHSYDAALLKRIIDYCLEKGYNIIPKHDDYITELNAFDEIEGIIQDFISEVIKTKDLDRVLTEIVFNAKKFGGGIIDKPYIVYGTADGSEPYVGRNFLLP